MGIKRRASDNWMSKAVRAAADYTCERCGKRHEPNSMGLHLSHFYTRGARSVRFDTRNAFVHCYGCHAYLGSHWDEFSAWAASQRGPEWFEDITKRKNNTRLKITKDEEKLISKHYREEYRRIEAERERPGPMKLINYMEIRDET